MKNNLLFVISHQPNPRFIKQINYFAQNGFNVSVIYFYRDYLADLNSSIDKNVNLYLLDKIENGKYLQRVLIYLKSIFKIKFFLKEIEPNKVIITNIDILFLLILNNIKKYTDDIVMEISDLRGYTFNNNFTDKIQKSIDSIVLDRYISKMIFTSPEFYNFYYKNKFNGSCFILENKPLFTIMPPKVKKVKNKKLVVGIVGLLLDKNPHKALFEYVKDKNYIEVHIYGKGTYQKQVEYYAKKYENIKYFREYNFFTDISKIYASLDMIYMSYDTKQGDYNIKLALPNKLYEAIYFKVPIITTKDTYLAKRVLDSKIGYTIKCCDLNDLESAINSFKLDKDNFPSLFENIDEKLYVADSDYVELVKFIKG